MLLRRKLNLLISAVSLVAAVVIYAVTIWILDNFLTQSGATQRHAIASSISQDIEVFDRLLLLVEKRWDQELAESLPKLAEELQALNLSNNEINEALLNSLRNKYRLSDLHLIDKNLIVFASTSSSEVGLDMTGYGEDYENNLRQLMNNNAFFTHRVSLSTVDGNLKKYAYYSVEGSDLIINGDYDLAKRLARQKNEQLADYLFGDYVKELVDKYREIKQVDLFILSPVDQWSLFNPGNRIEDKAARALFNGEMMPADDTNILMEHVDLQSYRQVGFKAFLKIEFDTSLLAQTKSNLKLILFSVAMAIVIVTTLILRFISQRLVVDRFTNLLHQLRQKQAGTSERIEMSGKDELAILSHEINEMMDRIKREEEMNIWLTGISQKDSLTELANRRWFDEKFEFEYSRAKLAQSNLSLIMIDIDHFKEYNDEYGHLKGDDCLRTVASTIARSLSRPTDEVARFGGEEFICLLPNTDIHGAQKLAEEMRSSVEHLQLDHASSRVAKHVTISAGCFTYNGTKELSAKDVLREVDERLYTAKRKGRNCVVAHSEQGRS
ncbi:diguanylate cyclase domain-containing protein [Ningiella sp. W23]|uniref:diguanylate cyclase domain-containing protein n=1 Tax=Ningiella sp. W23 TaxID=3023715 RepID=UPI0037562D68